MLKELIIFAIVLVALDVGVKFLIARFAVNKAKNGIKKAMSFRIADWHLKRYEKLCCKKRK